MEKLLFENGKEEEQLVRTPNNLETNEILKKYGSNRTSECEAQERATTMQTPPPWTISVPWEARMRKSTLENNNRLAQQSFSIQLKEVQAFKHQEYLLHKSKECTMEAMYTRMIKNSLQQNNNKRERITLIITVATANDQDNQRGIAEKPATTTATTIKTIRATRSTPISHSLKPKRGCSSLATHIFDGSMNQNLFPSILLLKALGS